MRIVESRATFRTSRKTINVTCTTHIDMLPWCTIKIERIGGTCVS